MTKRKMFSIAHNAEVVVADKVERDPYAYSSTKNRAKIEAKNEKDRKVFFEKRCKTDKANSYATENILRSNFEKEWKANPGNRHEIVRKYMRKG